MLRETYYKQLISMYDPARIAIDQLSVESDWIYNLSHEIAEQTGEIQCRVTLTSESGVDYAGQGSGHCCDSAMSEAILDAIARRYASQPDVVDRDLERCRFDLRACKNLQDAIETINSQPLVTDCENRVKTAVMDLYTT